MPSNDKRKVIFSAWHISPSMGLISYCSIRLSLEQLARHIHRNIVMKLYKYFLWVSEYFIKKDKFIMPTIFIPNMVGIIIIFLFNYVFILCCSWVGC